VLELYIPPGSREGDKIVLAGEADQQPDQEPGDLVFELKEEEHEVFKRAGADLVADCDISLVESLAGFERVVVKHLDGRGISICHPRGKVLRPGQILKVPGEGMPIKRSEAKGDLYLVVKIDFPKDGWLGDDTKEQRLRELLPKPKLNDALKTDTVDECDFEDGDLEDFGAGSGDPRATEWEDEDEEGGEAPQCATQ